MTMRGEKLLATLRREARHGKPLAATLRHAERHPITDPAWPDLPELTTTGRADAEAFGAALEGFELVRLFHSPVVRCRQTAEGIAAGVQRAGGRVEMLGVHESLGIGYTRDRLEFGRLFEIHGDNRFMRLWCDGVLPEKVLAPASSCSTQIREFIHRRLGDHALNARVLDLHVSHDINIMAVREACLGLRHEEAGWLEFLDGVVFQSTADGVRALGGK